MASSILAISTLMSLALAQTTVMKLPYPDGDNEDTSFLVNILSANAASTVIEMHCPPSTDCGLFPYQTLTYGPSTWHLDMSVPGDGFTMTQDCSFGASSAVCKESASGIEANFPGSSTETYDNGSITVTATKGVDKLAGAAKVTPTLGGSSSAPAVTGSAASQTLATVTQTNASGTPSGTATGAPESTGAAAANVVTLGRGLVGAGVALLAGMFL